MNNWTQTTLGEVSKVQTGPFGSQLKNEQYITGGTPVITVEHINDFKIKNFDYPSVTSEDRDRLSKYLLKEGDIVFTRVGSVDLSAYVSKNQDGWMFSSRMLSVRPIKKVHSKYLSYFFRQPLFRSYIYRISVGATMPSINTSILKSIPISFPLLPEQKAISNVLTAFDDKIELLQKQNKTLETMAQTIFIEWFGKYQIGDELPEGWCFGRLGKIANHIKQNIKPFNNPEKLYNHFSLPAFDNGLKPINECGIEIRSNKYAVLGNSFLVSKLNPFTPRIWTIIDSMENNICSTEFQVVKPKKESSFSLIHCFLNSEYFTSELSQKIQGTSSSHQRVKPQDIFDVELVIPIEKDILAFNNIIAPLICKKDVNHKQIQSLTKTRDTLLPKLMSGQVRVKNIINLTDA